MRYLRLISFLLLPVLLPACGAFGDDDNDAENLEGSWRVEAVHAQRSVQTVPADEQYIFELGKNGTVATWTSGCNTCTGTYHVGSTGTLEFQISCTEMACDPLPTYGALLGGERVYDLKDDRLYVRAENDEHTSIELRRVAAP